MAWTFPIPQRSAYRQTHNPNFRETTMSSGPRRRRRLSTSYEVDIPIRIHLTDAERKAFLVWYHDEALDGAAQVVIPVITDGDLADHAGLVEPPRISPEGSGGWRVDMIFSTTEKNLS